MTDTSPLLVHKPNTGWPELLRTQEFKWQIDVYQAANSESITYDSITIHRVTDDQDVTSDFNVSGSGAFSKTGIVYTVTAQLCTVPADAQLVDYQAFIWWLDSGVKEVSIVKFRVIDNA